ncbi:hypothetical protein D9M69_574600 [compost metagenome]
MDAKAVKHETFAEIKAASDAKLSRLRKSSGYKSFFACDAVEAFRQVSVSAYAGKPLKKKAAPSC